MARKRDLPPPSMESAPRFWYAAQQDLNTGVPTDTWRERHDLQRDHGGSGTGATRPPEGQDNFKGQACFGL
jgi:hypothetical protein